MCKRPVMHGDKNFNKLPPLLVNMVQTVFCINGNGITGRVQIALPSAMRCLQTLHKASADTSWMPDALGRVGIHRLPMQQVRGKMYVTCDVYCKRYMYSWVYLTVSAGSGMFRCVVWCRCHHFSVPFSQVSWYT